MALVLVPAFCLLTGAYAQEWGVKLTPGPLAGGTGSCVTIPCSFTYPAGMTVWAVIWTRDEDQTVYHSDEARVHPEFEGRARYLGDLQRDCSLRVSGLRPSDQGTYRFRFYAVSAVKNDTWGTKAGPRLRVSEAPTGVRVTAAPGTSPQAGESVTLTCNYTSSLPAPNSYTWYRGGRQLEGSQQEMVLKNITAEQAGEYHCKADNGIGQSESPPITITVWSTPRVWTPAYILGPAVALVPLLLVGLVGVIAWRKRRSKRQGLSSDPHAHRGVPGLSGWHRAIPHLQPAHEHGESTIGAELSRRPETESPYEELQGRTQDIYSELVYPQAGSH
ncbi:unnamed protein product [Natator depressus]|uniref:B-cell receptor CD22-like n=1 Tax=Natator depressus TaxID=27790 RepID=UPI003D3E9B59